MKVENEGVCGDPDITVQVLSFEDHWDRFALETPFGRIEIRQNDFRNGITVRLSCFGTDKSRLVVKPVVSNVIELGAE